MENKIPTAEEFIVNNLNSFDWKEVKFAMIEFAKLHVKAALQAATEEATIDDIGSISPYGDWMPCNIVNKESIINSYPDKNIK